MNDRGKYNFKQIAQIIRAKYLNQEWPGFLIDDIIAYGIRNK
jgi:hypothetical protein